MNTKIAYRAIALAPLVPAALIQPNGAIGSFLLAIAALAGLKIARESTFRLIQISWRKALILGVSGGLLLQPVTSLAQSLVRQLGAAPAELGRYGEIQGNLSAYLALLALAIIVGGILEELVFRGFVVGFGTSVWGERAAWPLVISSALTFGLAHAYQGPAGMVASALSGLVFGTLYLWSKRSLIVPILAHAINNTVGVTALYLGFGPA